jgi:D-glycero-D-manno-heptose 1,7-bisphosphate phosphatase
VTGRWFVAWDHGPLALESAGRADTAGRPPAAFLDRDGVLNEGIADPDSGHLESPLRVADVRLLPGVAQALRKLAQAGYRLVCVSNQPSAAKGKVSLQELLEVHERVVELLAQEGVGLDASRLCPHHPDGVVEGLAGQCDCRKPAPGMLLDAARVIDLDRGASWMFGDTDTDVEAGQAASCRTVLIEYPGSTHKRSGLTSPALRAVDLADGVAQLIDHGPG